ncbi:hypothetical protein HYQ46_006591 [Verticillium longisporum]|uniref:Uncharacterized protein n=1 Tax=Verticillium dahliae TaxID=27337 RepID=A0A444RK24_VERDA|nr:hypothetical protein HYQ46_006591 [Verticillium longisporum]RXG41550.1 hypothetical protein VDGE_20665 [Verticillium dahliae]
MLRLFSSMGILNQIMLILAATTAIVIGVSAVRYIFLSDSKDEFNYEDDDAIYAFYGASRKRGAGRMKRRLRNDIYQLDNRYERRDSILRLSIL